MEQDEYNSIYIKSDYSQAYGFWIASPAAGYTEESHWLLYAPENGEIGKGRSIEDINQGFRPLVCLKSEIQLESTESGNYRIVE